MIKFKVFPLLLLTYSISAFSGVTDDDFDNCSKYLDKIVASSDANLINELKVDRDLITADIDRVSNDNIYAKVQFNNKQSVDTPGEGFLLWMKYDYLKFSLEDITIDPDKPEKLKFDERYASVYLNCLNKKQSTKLLVLLDCSSIKMISYLFQVKVYSFCQGVCRGRRQLRECFAY